MKTKLVADDNFFYQFKVQLVRFCKNFVLLLKYPFTLAFFSKPLYFSK